MSALNPILKIDAFVWSFVFLEKIDRYDNRVYLIASYLLETVKMLNEKSENDFRNFNFNFNPFLMPFDFKNNIEKVNRPLSKKEMEVELAKKNKIDQSFRYNFDDKETVSYVLDEVH